METILNKESRAAIEIMVADGIIAKNTAERYFPELKESEDERIVKELLTFFRESMHGGHILTNKEYDSWIAWLEKQGEPTEINPSEFDSQLNRLLKQFESLSKEELASSLSFYLNVVQNDGTYKSDEKQDEQKYTQRDIDDAYLKGIADAKREVEKIDEQTEKMKKEIAEFIFNSKEDIKQRHEWIKCLGFDIISNEEKQGERKSTDKVKSKFRVGDWIVYCNQDVDLITGISDKGYDINNSGFIPFCCEKDMRYWTTMDVKPGDVLADECRSLENPLIFILKDFNGIKEETDHWSDYHSFCFLKASKKQEFCIGSWHNKDNLMPATREQCNLLFQKMKEAGYEWDADKKELKKIEPDNGSFWEGYNTAKRKYEQKHVDADLKDIVDKEANSIWKEINTGGSHSIIDSFNQFYGICMQVAETVVNCKKPAEWSEEDARMLEDTLDMVEWYSGKNEDKVRAVSNWLKSLKERVQPQPKQEWSKEDEQTFIKAVEAFDEKDEL